MLAIPLSPWKTNGRQKNPSNFVLSYRCCSLGIAREGGGAFEGGGVSTHLSRTYLSNNYCFSMNYVSYSLYSNSFVPLEVISVLNVNTAWPSTIPPPLLLSFLDRLRRFQTFFHVFLLPCCCCCRPSISSFCLSAWKGEKDLWTLKEVLLSYSFISVEWADGKLPKPDIGSFFPSTPPSDDDEVKLFRRGLTEQCGSYRPFDVLVLWMCSLLPAWWWWVVREDKFFCINRGVKS